MKIEELESRLSAVEKQVSTLQDIEEIKKLQRCYGYYYEHGMAKEIADLFADDPDAAIHFRGIGSFLGANVKRNWENLPGQYSPNFLHFLMMCSGVVDVDPDGATAKGRWYGLGMVAVPHGDIINHSSFAGVYENQYVKQNGIWKIKVLDLALVYKIKKFGEGFVDPEKFKLAIFDPNEDASIRSEVAKAFDSPDDLKTDYPSGYTHPFHFKHPVTRKETDERARNAALTMKKVGGAI